MVKGYKDLIRVIELDEADKKVGFASSVILCAYYDELLSHSNSYDMRAHYKDLITGVLLGLRFLNYIDEDTFHLLGDEAVNLLLAKDK